MKSMKMGTREIPDLDKAEKWFRKFKKVLKEMPDDVAILLNERVVGECGAYLFSREELLESYEEAEDLMGWSGPEDYIDKFDTKERTVFVNNHGI